MSGYHYLTLHGTTVTCTDPATLDWVVAQVRKYIPSAEVRNEQREALTGEQYQLQLHRLDGKDKQVNIYLRRSLPPAGWRLLRIDSTNSNYLADGYITENAATAIAQHQHYYVFEKSYP